MVAPISPTKARFSLGQVVITPGAMSVIAGAGQQPAEFLARHQQGDWGELDTEDKKSNDAAIAHEGDVNQQDRILSAYKTASGVKIWIITEHDRTPRPCCCRKSIEVTASVI